MSQHHQKESNSTNRPVGIQTDTILPYTNDISGSLINETSRLARNSGTSASFKELKKSYEMRKRIFTKDIHSALETTHEVHSGWLKARTALKRWPRVWCQVKPGYLVLYTSQEAQKKHRIGVLLISICQAIHRPTKKDGFCFKLINPFGCSVWAKTSTKALTFPQSSLTLRASDRSIGKIWLDSLHRCNLSSNLDASQVKVSNQLDISDSDDGDSTTRHLTSLFLSNASNSTSNTNSLRSLNNNNETGSGRPILNGFQRQGSDYETPTYPTDNQGMVGINGIDRTSLSQAMNILERATTQSGGDPSGNPKSSNSKMVIKFGRYNWRELQLEDVHYIEENSEELGSAGVQSEEVHESNKSLLWHIIKQLRPGMDLSKVTLPTFILEPRSFLERLADYYYHCDILSEAVLIDDPLLRLINIVKWYLSGFYKKPSGPKKPYNPILGEKFRCFWDHPKTQSRTFFVAEQVSHHPPISAFHVTNRKDGYTIVCALLSRSKFTGNSVSAILDGRAKLYLTKRDETYTLTMPFANCRGILLGSLCLELGGKVEIECIQTGCKCELDFKLATVWGNSNSYNSLTGKIYSKNKVTHTLEGHWDKKITLIDKGSNKKSVLWEVTDTVRKSRLKRYAVSPDAQQDRESVKLWSKVTEALSASDQIEATVEKTKLEDMQRKEARERRGTHEPDLFAQVTGSNVWQYKWQDDRPWNDRRDIMQYETDFRIKTLMLNASGETLEDPLNPSIDLPLTQLTKFSDGAGSKVSSRVNVGSKHNAKGNSSTSEPPLTSVESKLSAENVLIKKAIEQVLEKHRKLEEELMRLKRSKKKVALIMAFIVAIISAVFFRNSV